ncbi:uncharacterized protein LOC143020602 isoform X1 [Oratosquilla oratoria]|uniref:uncharacterized protein LOC143020602 isoform X1 n=1 Tax=Oratosquilla oratoria TaxID=337810 RepID=UPI003F76C0F7
MVPSQEKLSTHLLHFPKVRVVIIMYLNTIFYKHTSLFLKPTGNNSGNVGNPSTRPTWSTSDESSARSPGLTLPCPKASPPLGTPSQSDLHSLLDRRPTHHLFHLPQVRQGLGCPPVQWHTSQAHGIPARGINVKRPNFGGLSPPHPWSHDSAVYAHVHPISHSTSGASLDQIADLRILGHFGHLHRFTRYHTHRSGRTWDALQSNPTPVTHTLSPPEA